VTTYELAITTVAVVNLVLNLSLFQANRHKASTERVERMRSDIDDHALRLARIDAHLQNSPSHDHLSEIYEQLNRTRDQVGRMAGELEQVNRNLQMLLNHQLKGPH